jgi:hypothetical protein
MWVKKFSTQRRKDAEKKNKEINSVSPRLCVSVSVAGISTCF